MDYFLLISLSLFVISLVFYFIKGIFFIKSVKIILGLGVFSSCLLYSLYYAANYFTGEGINRAVIYHVKYGIAGSGLNEYLGIIMIFGLFVLISLLVSLYFVFTTRFDNKKFSFSTVFVLLFLILSLILNPVFLSYVSLNISGVDGYEFDKNSEFFSYYRLPNATKNNESKNFVFIYAESFERTYFNDTIFPELTNNLKKLESEAISFTNITQAVGTGWTMGAMVSTQCGIPLFTPSHGNSMSGMDSFLDNAYCLGDFLYNEGYHLSYYGGADTSFAGKDNFFHTHKFSEVNGLYELDDYLDNSDYKSNWGLYDDSLLNIAYEKFLENSQKHSKFGMFVLTLDTHHPSGHASEFCADLIYQNGSNQMLNSVYCSDKLISEFVEKIKKSKYGNDTVIVVASDHLAMPNDAKNLLNKGNRNNLFFVLDDSTDSEVNKNQGTTIDIASTILPFLGYGVEIGLGRDLNNIDFNESEKEYIHQNLANWSEDMAFLWGFPKINDRIFINLNTESVIVDGRRSFKFPLLIEMDDELNTIFKFDFDRSVGHKTLVDHVYEASLDSRFILIDKCEDVSKLKNISSEKKYCLFVGNKINMNVYELKNDLKLFRNQILDDTDIKLEALAIAHAGGGINNKTYTNSFEALDYNYNKGFRFFEIDFSFTSDGELVCLHDWEHSFKRSFGFSTESRVSLREFNELVENSSVYNKCNLYSLSEWLNNHSDAFLVTDVKEDNIRALNLISSAISNFEIKVIPQIYTPNSYHKVKDIGFDNIILTLYRYKGSDDDVIEKIADFDKLFAVTMHKSRAKTNFPTRVRDMGYYVYAHTVNDLKEKEENCLRFIM